MDKIFQFLQLHIPALMTVGYKIFLAVALIVVALIVSKIIKRGIARTNQRFKGFDATLVPIFSTTASYAVYAIALLVVLDMFGVNTNSIIALLGAAGLAIGLALKDTLSHIAAGIGLILLRPFRAEEYIECGEIAGTVKEIGLFTTILETADGLFISSPNGLLWGSAVKNYNRNGQRRIDLTVRISYSDSIDTAMKVLQKVAMEEARFLKAPQPQVMVQSLGDSAVNLTLRAWTTTDDYWNVMWDQTKNIKERIEEIGLSIPLPQQEVWHRSISSDERSNII